MKTTRSAARTPFFLFTDITALVGLLLHEPLPDAGLRGAARGPAIAKGFRRPALAAPEAR